MTGGFDIRDKKAGTTNGQQLVVDRCGCGARRGVDYEKFAEHLPEHSPEEFGLTPRWER